jgi:hypothetical protein
MSRKVFLMFLLASLQILTSSFHPTTPPNENSGNSLKGEWERSFSSAFEIADNQSS